MGEEERSRETNYYTIEVVHIRDDKRLNNGSGE